MSRLRRKKALLALVSCSVLACLAAGSAHRQSARDDVPEDYVALTNPFQEIPSGRVRYFEKKYKAHCARCHGIDGRGGGENAEAQGVPPRDFTDAAFMATRSDGQLFYQILMGGGDRSGMPAYGPESDVGWSEERVWKLVIFVRRFAEAPSPAR